MPKPRPQPRSARSDENRLASGHRGRLYRRSLPKRRSRPSFAIWKRRRGWTAPPSASPLLSRHAGSTKPVDRNPGGQRHRAGPHNSPRQQAGGPVRNNEQSGQASLPALRRDHADGRPGPRLRRPQAGHAGRMADAAGRHRRRRIAASGGPARTAGGDRHQCRRDHRRDGGMAALRPAGAPDRQGLEGKYRGQKQRWVLARFTGTDADIDLATDHPEFDAWQWVEPGQLVERIVPFKRRSTKRSWRSSGRCSLRSNHHLDVHPQEVLGGAEPVAAERDGLRRVTGDGDPDQARRRRRSRWSDRTRPSPAPGR